MSAHAFTCAFVCCDTYVIAVQAAGWAKIDQAEVQRGALQGVFPCEQLAAPPPIHLFMHTRPPSCCWISSLMLPLLSPFVPTSTPKFLYHRPLFPPSSSPSPFPHCFRLRSQVSVVLPFPSFPFPLFPSPMPLHPLQPSHFS